MGRRRIKGRPYKCHYGCKTWEECEDRNSTPDEQLRGVLNAARNDIFYANCICWEWFEHVLLTDLCKISKKNY